MGWKALQLTVFLAVGCALIYARENDHTGELEFLRNPYLIGLTGLAAAYLATAIPSKLIDLARRWKGRRLLAE